MLGSLFQLGPTRSFSFLFIGICIEIKACLGGKLGGHLIYKNNTESSKTLFVYSAVSTILNLYASCWKSYARKPVVQEEIDLFSCFATPEWWANDTDRYFPKLTSHYSADRLKTVYFLPRAIGNKNWWRLREENQKYRGGDKNVLILEDHITLKDCLFSWSHCIRVLKIKKPKILVWDGMGCRLALLQGVYVAFLIIGFYEVNFILSLCKEPEKQLRRH